MAKLAQAECCLLRKGRTWTSLNCASHIAVWEDVRVCPGAKKIGNNACKAWNHPQSQSSRWHSLSGTLAGKTALETDQKDPEGPRKWSEG